MPGCDCSECRSDHRAGYRNGPGPLLECPRGLRPGPAQPQYGASFQELSERKTDHSPTRLPCAARRHVAPCRLRLVPIHEARHRTPARAGYRRCGTFLDRERLPRGTPGRRAAELQVCRVPAEYERYRHHRTARSASLPAPPARIFHHRESRQRKSQADGDGDLPRRARQTDGIQAAPPRSRPPAGNRHTKRWSCSKKPKEEGTGGISKPCLLYLPGYMRPRPIASIHALLSPVSDAGCNRVSYCHVDVGTLAGGSKHPATSFLTIESGRMDIPVRHLPHDGQECPSYIMPGNSWPGA